MLSGGVSANKELRFQLSEAVKKSLPGVNFLIPELEYTTDNAAMIAAATFYKFQKGGAISFAKLRTDASLQLK